MDQHTDLLPGTDPVHRVFGTAYERPDGSLVIPVATPVGVYVVHDGKATWTPAVDRTRIALLGGLIGLAAATLATAAVLRRPPWPDVSVRIRKGG